MRIALIVGINHYEHGDPLYGCVDDAHTVKTALDRHGDGSINFDCKIFTGRIQDPSATPLGLMNEGGVLG